MIKDRLFIFPIHKEKFYKVVKDAKDQILLSSQVLPDKNFCDIIKILHGNGVRIKILISDPRYFNLFSNEKISEFHGVHADIVNYSNKKLPSSEEKIFSLNQAGIYPHFVNHNKFFLNHSKYLVIDSKQVFVGSSVYSRNSKIELGLLSNNLSIVRMLKRIFYLDYENKKSNAKFNSEKLIVAPDNMRKSIVKFIDGAKKTILIFSTVITDDPEIFELLCKKVLEGIDTRVLCSPHIFTLGGNNYKSIMDHFYNLKLQSLGGIIRMSYNPLIHGKVIIVDHECPKWQKALFSSANLRTSSLDKCREVGLYSSDPDVLTEATSFFKSIWEKAIEYR